ncbi:MAG: hypothetical protein U5R49_15445 [Deltaproteobacteria bacterium]|nr:hypothetical protein [Deltaproteobacteria bacterium]
MDRIRKQLCIWIVVSMGVVLFLGTGAQGAIVGEHGSVFHLVVKQDVIVTSDGDSFLMWGYALAESDWGPTSARRNIPDQLLL